MMGYCVPNKREISQAAEFFPRNRFDSKGLGKDPIHQLRIDDASRIRVEPLESLVGAPRNWLGAKIFQPGKVFTNQPVIGHASAEITNEIFKRNNTEEDRQSRKRFQKIDCITKRI